MVISVENSAPTEMLGEQVSHYRIVSKLGSGGVGVVYEAEDVNLGRGRDGAVATGGTCGIGAEPSEHLHDP